MLRYNMTLDDLVKLTNTLIGTQKYLQDNQEYVVSKRQTFGYLQEQESERPDDEATATAFGQFAEGLEQDEAYKHYVLNEGIAKKTDADLKKYIGEHSNEIVEAYSDQTLQSLAMKYDPKAKHIREREEAIQKKDVQSLKKRMLGALDEDNDYLAQYIALYSPEQTLRAATRGVAIQEQIYVRDNLMFEDKKEKGYIFNKEKTQGIVLKALKDNPDAYMTLAEQYMQQIMQK